MSENSTTAENTMEALRAEVESLREQLKKAVEPVNEKMQDKAEEMASRIAKEMRHYGNLAAENADNLKNLGQAGLEDVSEQIRSKPLTSLLLAFGAGCILTTLWRSLR